MAVNLGVLYKKGRQRYFRFLNSFVPLKSISYLYPFANSCFTSSMFRASDTEYSSCSVLATMVVVIGELISGETLISLYAFVYASLISSSVGRLYASRLLINSCPNIWSIQFGFTFAFSKFVCSIFLRLCALIFFSPILRNAFLISVVMFSLLIGFTFPFRHIRNNGLSFVTFSGSIPLDPFFLCST